MDRSSKVRRTDSRRRPDDWPSDGDSLAAGSGRFFVDNDKNAFIFPFSRPFGPNNDICAFIFGPGSGNRTNFSILMAQNALIFLKSLFSRKNNSIFVVVSQNKRSAGTAPVRSVAPAPSGI
jgi:hypothetical protein